jgi:hypothetical protein
MAQRIEQSVGINLARLVVVATVLILLATVAPAQKIRRKRVVIPPAQPQVNQKEIKELSDAASKSRAHLIETSKVYRESLERLQELQKQDEERAAVLVEKNRELLDAGLIAKRQLDEIEQQLIETRNKIAETQKQIDSVDLLVAEVKAAEELAKMPAVPQGTYRSTAMLVRYVGASRWAMSDFTKVDAFFRLKFRKPLPVSALGQTDTHSRLGFDHHDAVDVAVHPDGAEGQELINYLRSQGISFIAIRGAIPGSATGAHIHIGPSSKRIIAR